MVRFIHWYPHTAAYLLGDCEHGASDKPSLGTLSRLKVWHRSTRKLQDTWIWLSWTTIFGARDILWYLLNHIHHIYFVLNLTKFSCVGYLIKFLKPCTLHIFGIEFGLVGQQLFVRGIFYIFLKQYTPHIFRIRFELSWTTTFRAWIFHYIF